MPIRPLMPRKNLSDVQNPATALANLGGQPADADLTAIAALTTQSFGRSVLTTADAPSLRALAGALGGSLGSTDNRLLRSDGTGGATAQGSAVTVDDSGNVSGVVTLSATTGIISSGYVLTFGSGAALNYNGASIKLPGSAAIAWGASLDAAWRTRLYESAAGVLTVDNGSGGSAALAITGNLIASGLSVTSTVTVGASTFAALPSASANTGAILRVTDRGQKLVHSDGTDWRFVHDNTIAS